MQDEEVARQLQRQFDAEAAELRASVGPGPLGRAQSATGGGHGGGAAVAQRRASISGPIGGEAGSRSSHGGNAASGSSPTRPTHGKSPSAPPLSAVAGGDAMAWGGIPDSELCVICLEAPQEAGFLHGSTVHRCCCKKCALELKRNNTELCPLCRERIDHVVLAVY